MRKKRLILGISGASGAAIGIEALEMMRGQSGWECHLIMTRAAEQTIETETAYSAKQVKALADAAYDCFDTAAPPASGSFRADGMLIAPCSMKTLAGIHSGYAGNLLLRAADVTLKEGRRLVLCPRESPLSAIHLRNMQELAAMGAVIAPPVITCYLRDCSAQGMIRQCAARLLERFGIETGCVQRWKDGEEE